MIVVTLDSYENSCSKAPFAVTMSMHLTNVDCELRVAQRHDFKIDIRDLDAKQKVYEFMYEVLASSFDGDPWDNPKDQTIGFIPL